MCVKLFFHTGFIFFDGLDGQRRNGREGRKP
jgi:hypothetical protein